MNQKLFRALDDPTRRKILELLKTRERTAGEIAAEFDISKPSISYHLDLLRQAELVTAVRDGQFIRYALSASVIEEAIVWLMQITSKSREGIDEPPDHTT